MINEKLTFACFAVWNGHYRCDCAGRCIACEATQQIGTYCQNRRDTNIRCEAILRSFGSSTGAFKVQHDLELDRENLFVRFIQTPVKEVAT